MIKYFTVENFKSIKTESILEFDTNLGKSYPYPASSVIGFAGANASGKTCILQAITFVFWFMQSSFLQLKEDAHIPCEPFIGQDELPSKFQVIFTPKNLVETQEKYVDYEYKLSLFPDRVVREELYYYPYRRQRKAYFRERNQVQFGDSVRHIDKESILNLRQNCSFVSFAAQFSSQEVARSCQDYKFKSNVGHLGMGMEEYKFSPSIIERLAVDQESKLKALELLKIADVGIEDFEFIKPQTVKNIFTSELLDNIPQESLEKLINSLTEISRNLSQSDNLELDSNVTERLPASSLLFKHNFDNEIKGLKYIQESAGTLQFIVLVNEVLSALKLGGLLIIDEIEIKLHQNLVAYLIGLFQNKYENNKGAQLIFSFHNTYLMEILKPHQLWFTEKNDGGYTEIFSAADFKDIKKLYERNLEELYRLGRFGAKPRGI